MRQQQVIRGVHSRRRVVVAVALVAALVAAVPVGAASASAASSAAPTQTGPEISAQVADQMEAITEEKADRTPTEQKLDSNLLYATREDASQPAVEGAPELTSSLDVGSDGTVLVDIDATVTPGLTSAIDAAGGDVVAAVPGFDAVRAELPIDAVLDLASRRDVTGIRPADEAITNEGAGDGATTASVGAGLNEADVTHGADTARGTYGIDGTGVKVCVLSDGVTSLAARQASGDLPAVDVLSGQAGSGDEGTAMLELIHDIAPGAPLGFATAFTSQASFAQNIVSLKNAGCKVIVDDVSYFAETTFQDADVAQSISTVRAAGVTYFSSAGNSGNLLDGTSGTWQGDFQDIGASASPLPTGSRVHGWGVGVGSNPIVTATSAPINLQWADPVGGSANDYDLFVLNSAGTSILAQSTNVQSGSGNPSESINYSSSVMVAGNRVVVTKKTGAADRYLVVYTNRGVLTYKTGGAARGHNVSDAAVTVAATPVRTALGSGHPTGPYPSTFSASNVSEKFSSDGPTRQYFTPAGAALTPGNFSSTGGVGRNGVDITAGDGAATTTPGFIPFFGTSAAAPNAAAIAALALEAKPTLTPTQLEAAIASSAIDIEVAGTDTVTGPGILMAPTLMTTIGAAAKAKLSAGAVTVTPTTGDGDGYVEPGETATLAQVLTNLGGATATGITATLVSNSANATVTQGSTSYGSIGAGASGSPTGTPLAFSVAPGCPCGAVLPFTLTVSYGGGAQPTVAIPVAISVGAPATPVDAAYAGSPVAIPDNSTTGASAQVAVASTARVKGVTVTIGGTSCSTTAGSTTVGIDHSYVKDLTLTLTSPQGTVVTLMTGVGDGGNNLCQTVFTDSAASDIQSQTAAAAPFTGSFRPASPLSTLVGQNPQGNWTLKAVDNAAVDTGSIRAFSIQITGADCGTTNTAPTAANDSYNAVQDQALTVAAPGVLGNDTDGEGNALTAVLVAGPSHGTLSLNATGSFTYTPTAGYHGADSFTYKANDGTVSGNTATVSLTVNGTPTAVANSYATGQGQTLAVGAPGVLGNDTDPEGNALTAVLGAGPGHGTLTLNPNGSFSYVPTAGYSGADSFTYRASDGSSSSPLATVSLTVNGTPTGVADAYATPINTAKVVAAPGVLGNDTDPEGNALTAVLVAGPAHGTLALNADGSFTYTPTGGYSGGDSFTYKASDGTTQSAITTVTLTVDPPGNQAPTAVGDSYATGQGQALVVAVPGVLGNDSDPESSPLSAVLVTGPTHGSLALNANGSFTYTPTAGYHGTDSFTYKANDGTVSGNTATVSLTVNGTPSGTPDSYTTPFETAKVVAAPGVLGNDGDPEGNALTAVLVAGPAHGTLALNADGSFTYTPTGGYSGGDSFTYKASDGTTQSATTTVTLTVQSAGNQAPVAVGDSLSAVAGTARTKVAPGVLANDTDADGNPLTAVLASGPAHGTLTLNADGSYTYTAAVGYSGADSFTYKASDGTAQSPAATVSITVITPTQAYVAAIYRDFLSRAGDAGGMTYWGNRLDTGVETRTTFVRKMSRSHEYSVKIVTRAFNDVLGRNPDPSGREFWANRVQKGMPVADLVLNLIASNEYLTKTGGTVAGFVNSTFQAILARQPTAAERTARVNQINGGKSRLSVASELYATVSSRQRRTRTQFQLLLNRTPTSTELNTWVSKLATKSDVDLAIFLGASNEYVANAQVLT